MNRTAPSRLNFAVVVCPIISHIATNIPLVFSNAAYLGSFGTQLCLVLQVPRLRPEPVATAWAPEAVSLYEYLADLAALLAGCVPSRADWLLSLVTNAYTLASHDTGIGLYNKARY
jgi:hypothetical protein